MLGYYRGFAVAAGLFVSISSGPAAAQVSVSSTPAIINFDTFMGDGLAPDPAAGQLDSDEWAIAGMSDGDVVFGGANAAGDYAKGTSTGGESSGGLYAFDTGAGDIAMGVQPTGSDFSPGTFTLRLVNNTGAAIDRLDVAYDICVYNNATRSSS